LSVRGECIHGLCQLFHSNIAGITALYCVGPKMHIVYEHNELDILDPALISITEIATVALSVLTNISDNNIQSQ
jgi:hypothetical protein